MAENTINPHQYELLQSSRGQVILPCWTDAQLHLREENGHIQPSSRACIRARYQLSIQPQVVDVEDMDKAAGSLLAKACSTCPIMADTLLLLQITRLS